MERGRPSLLGVALVGAAGLVVGMVVGRQLSRGEDQALFRGAASPLPGAATVPASFADIVQRAGPGVVTVRACLPLDAEDSRGESMADAGQAVFSPQPRLRTGSGFVVNARGLVVTSRHVVAGADAVEVLVPHRSPSQAVLVGQDPTADLALLRLLEPPADLCALPIGGSEDLRAGDWIVAVGNPFGFSQTVTAGVVSFVGRHLPHSDLGVTSDFLQISAPVNPGSSGCPVFDLRGRVVGVTTQAAAAAQGISFAVPSRTLQWALEAMERRPDGRVRRGYLGIEFASRAGVDEAGAPCGGAVIVRVFEGEPAERAGLRRGDVVLRVDGELVPDAEVLHDRIVHRDPGTRIALQLLRDGRVQDPIEAVLGEVGGPKVPGPAN